MARALGIFQDHPMRASRKGRTHHLYRVANDNNNDDGDVAAVGTSLRYDLTQAVLDIVIERLPLVRDCSYSVDVSGARGSRIS